MKRIRRIVQFSMLVLVLANCTHEEGDDSDSTAGGSTVERVSTDRGSGGKAQRSATGGTEPKTSRSSSVTHNGGTAHSASSDGGLTAGSATTLIGGTTSASSATTTGGSDSSGGASSSATGGTVATGGSRSSTSGGTVATGSTTGGASSTTGGVAGSTSCSKLVYCVPDRDGDGFGDRAASATQVCGSCPSGTVPQTNATDCCDGDASVHPGWVLYSVPAASSCASSMPAGVWDHDCSGLVQGEPCLTVDAATGTCLFSTNFTDDIAAALPAGGGCEDELDARVGWRCKYYGHWVGTLPVCGKSGRHVGCYWDSKLPGCIIDEDVTAVRVCR